MLRVSDTGAGMPPEKIEQLLAEKESLDGELHSLGFVFVRQTVAEFGGTLEIASEVGKGTTVTVRFPYLPDAVPPPRQPSRCEKYGQTEEDDRGARRAPPAGGGGPAQAAVPRRGGGRVGRGDPRGLPDVRIASPGEHLRDRRDRRRSGRLLHAPALREALGHHPRGPLPHVLPGHGARPARGGRGEAARPDPEGPAERARVLRLQGAARRRSGAPRPTTGWCTTSTSGSPASSSPRAWTRRSGVLLTDIPKLFPGCAALLEKEPVELRVLAEQRLTGE